MTFLIKYFCFVILALATRSCALLVVKEFRFDYEWSEEADGWLKYHAVPATWDEARQRCHAEGAVLASPLTEPLKAAIVAFTKKHTQSRSQHKIFTGVHATFSRGDYASIEGVPLLRLAVTWAVGEPDNYENSELCLMMQTHENGTLADTRCEVVLPYVCYKKDANVFMTECGTSDLDYILERRTGSCYKLHPYGLLWSQAYMTCMAEGGYLAIINDDVELGVVKDIFAKHPDSTIFTTFKTQFMIGLHDWGQRGRTFMTIHGQSLQSVYNKWQPNQPDSPWRAGNESPANRREYAVNMYRTGTLDDFTTNIPLAFLCEKDPNSLRN